MGRRCYAYDQDTVPDDDHGPLRARAAVAGGESEHDCRRGRHREDRAATRAEYSVPPWTAELMKLPFEERVESENASDRERYRGQLVSAASTCARVEGAQRGENLSNQPYARLSATVSPSNGKGKAARPAQRPLTCEGAQTRSGL